MCSYIFAMGVDSICTLPKHYEKQELGLQPSSLPYCNGIQKCT